MAKLTIRIYPDPVLRERCNEVPEITPDIIQLMSDMAETMYDAKGIGLAASQVGSLNRVIVVDVRDDDKGDIPDLIKMANPVIKFADGQIEMEEGCLSIPDIREKVKRMEHVVVDYVDEVGRVCELDAHGLLAVCLQHEIDHLNGTLFIDRLTPLRKDLIRSKLKGLKKGSSS